MWALGREHLGAPECVARAARPGMGLFQLRAGGGEPSWCEEVWGAGEPNSAPGNSWGKGHAIGVTPN